MKILLEAYAFYPNVGSEKQYGWDTAKNLIERGMEVHVLTSIRDELELKKILKLHNFQGLKVHFVRNFLFLEKFWRKIPFGYTIHYYFWLLNSFFYAKRLLNTVEFEIIHHVTYGSIQQGSYLSKLGKPFIFGPTGGGQFTPKIFLDQMSKRGKSIEFKRMLTSYLMVRYSPAFLWNAKKASIILCSNNDTIEMVQQVRKSDLGVSQLFDVHIEASSFPINYTKRPKLIGRKLKIVWIGSILARKGLNVVIDAIGQSERIKNGNLIEFDIYGDGDTIEKEFLNEKINFYEITHLINFKGYIEKEKLPLLLINYDLFVFPSVRESMGLQLLEAMACGLPILCFDQHGPKLLINEKVGYKISVVDYNQVLKDIESTILNILDEPDQLLMKGYNAFQYAKHFSDERFYTEIINCYNKLAKKV